MTEHICEKCEHEKECRNMVCFYELLEKKEEGIRADERREFAEKIKREFEYYYRGNVSKKRLRRILLDMLEKEQKK